MHLWPCVSLTVLTHDYIIHQLEISVTSRLPFLLGHNGPPSLSRQRLQCSAIHAHSATLVDGHVGLPRVWRKLPGKPGGLSKLYAVIDKGWWWLERQFFSPSSTHCSFVTGLVSALLSLYFVSHYTPIITGYFYKPFFYLQKNPQVWEQFLSILLIDLSSRLLLVLLLPSRKLLDCPENEPFPGDLYFVVNHGLQYLRTKQYLTWEKVQDYVSAYSVQFSSVVNGKQLLLLGRFGVKPTEPNE